MKANTAALLLVQFCLLLSCEIEDDFGETADIEVNEPIMLSPNVDWISWIDNETILCSTFPYSEIRAVKTTDNTSSSYYQLPLLAENENYAGVFHYLSPEKIVALVGWQSDDGMEYKTSLYMIETITNNLTLIAGNVTLSNHEIRYMINYNSELLAYSVLNENYTLETWIYDVNTASSIFVGPGSPLAFSPDGSQLLSNDYSIGSYFYDIDQNIQSPTPIFLQNYNSKIRWNEYGILEVYISSDDYITYTLTIQNHTTNTRINRAITYSTADVFISASGTQVIQGQISCLSPYFKLCPNQDSKVELFRVSTQSNDYVELMELRVNSGTSFSIDKLEFSPDETNVAFITNAQLFTNP